MTVQITAMELRYDDPGANSHKFYRVFSAPSIFAVQWGRVGADGQCKVYSGGLGSAYAKRDEKLAKGYMYHVGEFTFDSVSDACLRGTAASLTTLFSNAVRSAPLFQPPPTPEPEPAPAPDPVDEEAEKEMLNVLLRMRATSRGEEFVEEPAEPTMEDRLAAALAKARAN